MAQPPVADFYEDKETRMRHRRSGRRSYLVAVPVAGLVLAVAVLGAVGPRIAPAHTGGTPSTSPGAMVPAESPTQAIWSPPITAPTAQVSGLTEMRVIPRSVKTMSLDAGLNPVDADGGNLLYVSGNDLFIANAAQGGKPARIATARPCAWITGAAISGDRLIYAEIVVPAPPDTSAPSCPTSGPTGWHVSLVYLPTGDVSEVGAGTFSGVGPAGSTLALPVVDISQDVYCFSRPAADGQSATVEVHALADHGRVFASDPLPVPLQLKLANTKLIVAVFSPEEGATPGQQVILETNSWSSPLGRIGVIDGPMSLSRDGTRMGYSSCESMPCQPVIRIENDGDEATLLPAPPIWLSVDSAASALQTVAWISQTNSNEGGVYLGLKCNLWKDPVALEGISQPNWVHVQNDTLVWISFSGSDGSATLSQLELQTAFGDW
jgi:hypothetical protein